MTMSNQPVCAFPLFRKTFLSTCEWQDNEADHKDSSTSASCNNQTTAAPSHPRPMLQLNQINLQTLDLRSLGTEESPPSETRLRRQKMALFEKHCSEVYPGLHISGEYVAKNLDVLRQNGITHIVNCVGYMYQEYFKPEIQYKTLYLHGALPAGMD